ncbi:MAG TPA: ABC transporter permease [Candidatus Angelobacter sp.]|jgi:predicted permease
MQLLEGIRYALRQFKNTPGFTATATLTLALGIGATTAIFTLVHAVLLKSLPVARPEELLRIGNVEHCCVNDALQNNWSLFSYEQYRLFKENTPGFVELAAFQAGPRLIGVRRGNQPSESFSGEFVSGNYFSTFGISPYAGRLSTAQDDTKGAPVVAVMSFRTWQDKFGKDPSVVGGQFSINSQPVTIIGIAPPGFFGDQIRSNPPAFWIPIAAEPVIEPSYSLINEASWNWLNLIGRIQPGANPAALEAQMQVELRQFLMTPLAKVDPRNKARIPQQTLHFSAGGGGVQTMRNEYHDGLNLLMTVSGFVLLIACANLANLMMVRATARKQQISVRSALGATRSTLVRQAFTESVVLGAIGGIVGIATAFAATRMILVLAFGNEYVPIHATPSWPVLAFASGASLLSAILFGIAPAWMTANTNPIEALRGSSRSTGGRNTAWGQKSLVVAQVALSLSLLAAAGLLIRSLDNMRHQNFGFDTTNRYILSINPQMAGYKPAQLPALYRQIQDNLTKIPGVELSFSLYTPMDGEHNWGDKVFIEGEAPPPPGTPGVLFVRVAPGYFDAIGTHLLEGRTFTEQDLPTTRTVAVVNHLFETTYIKDGHALGRHFSNNKEHPGVFEIVGVTEDTNYWGPTSKIRPMYFLVQGQTAHIDDPRYQVFEDSSQFLNAIVVKTKTREVQGLDVQLRRALSGINPDLAVTNFQSFASQVDTNFTQQAMIAQLTSLFGLLAMVLASIGLYGVLAYSVERRTSEIGVRMALGADRRNVVTLVLRSAFIQVGIGILIGLLVAVFGGRVMANKLFGVTPHDPLVFSLTIFVLVIAAFVAGIIPARRAAKTEPILALRMD